MASALATDLEATAAGETGSASGVLAGETGCAIGVFGRTFSCRTTTSLSYDGGLGAVWGGDRRRLLKNSFEVAIYFVGLLNLWLRTWR